MEQGFQILQKQKQILSHVQLQSLNILAMDNVELEVFLQSEYLENPMLEHTETLAPISYGSKVISHEDDSFKWNCAATGDIPDLKTYLKNQLDLVKYQGRSLQLLHFLIECVDDDGFFTMDITEVSHLCQTPVEDMINYLDVLKNLEPVGVCSYDLKECLLKQLKVLNLNDPKIEAIIYNHLENIAAGNIGKISRALHISTVQVRKYIHMIKALNPRPAIGFGETATEYIVPDIILRKEEKWEIILNDSWIGNYEISHYYMNLMNETTDRELKEYFLAKGNRIRYILQNIEQRRQTLVSLTEHCIAHQTEFFDGHSPLKAMTMAQIAEEMEVHPSTISRAVKGKYIQYPQGTILLKDLFSQKVSADEDKEGSSAAEIKQTIRNLIDAEQVGTPYSDQKLKELLDEKDIHVSRRVVAKYRESMGIKGSFARKNNP